MLAVVKKPRTKAPLFEMKGDIPDKVIDYLKKNYEVDFQADEDEETIDIHETGWYKEARATRKPGDAMRVYRDNFGHSQAELGKLLGGLSRQKISDMENSRRGISKEIAKKLARIYNKPVEYFI
jgi:antitoxin component HigA of HigAB toxin-antitoxin module